MKTKNTSLNPSIWHQGAVRSDTAVIAKNLDPAPVAEPIEDQLAGLKSDIAERSKQKFALRLGTAKDRAPKPTTAELLLKLDEHGSMWTSALTEAEWALWKLHFVFGFSAAQLFNQVHTPQYTGFDLRQDCRWTAWTHIGQVGKDVSLDTVRMHWPPLMSTDQRTEMVQTGEYKIRRTREYHIASSMQLYVFGTQRLFALAEPFVTSVSAVEASLADCVAKVRKLAEFKVNLISPEPSVGQLEAKREMQKFALDSDAMDQIGMTVLEHETVTAWIDCGWNGRKAAIQLGGPQRTVAKIIGGFTDRCANAWFASKKKGKPVRAFEAFTNTFIVDLDTRRDDPDYEVALALTGKGGAFGGAYIKKHSHARSFDSYGRLVYENAGESTNSAERGLGSGTSEDSGVDTFWEVGSDDEFDGQ